jgi:hypothetical protein
MWKETTTLKLNANEHNSMQYLLKAMTDKSITYGAFY